MATMDRRTHMHAVMTEDSPGRYLPAGAGDAIVSALVERVRAFDPVSANRALHCGMYATRIACQLGMRRMHEQFWALGVLRGLERVVQPQDLQSAINAIPAHKMPGVTRDIVRVAEEFERGVHAACNGRHGGSPAHFFRSMQASPSQYNPLVVSALRRALAQPPAGTSCAPAVA